MNKIKVWPHLTIIAVVVALLAAVSVGFWMKQQQTTSAEELPSVARIQRVDGEVAFSDNLTNSNATDTNADWTVATANQWEIGSTQKIVHTPRSPLADAILRGSIQTLHLMSYPLETDARSSRSATARQCLKLVIWHLTNCLK